MLQHKNAKWLFALVLLVVVSTVEAAPSIGDMDVKVISPTGSAYSHTKSADNVTVELLINTNNPALAHIAADLLKPSVELTSQSALPTGTKPLPAVPAALFMALTGFLCVTLVRDRKVWLAVMTTILWAGQVGITALPQKCGACIAHHINKQWAVLTLTYPGEQASRLLSEFEGTEYIGLLHYLEGIPVKILNTGQSPQFAIASSSYYFVPSSNCIAKIVHPCWICFSQAFTFDNIPRGPPISLLELSFS